MKYITNNNKVVIRDCIIYLSIFTNNNKVVIRDYNIYLSILQIIIKLL